LRRNILYLFVSVVFLVLTFLLNRIEPDLAGFKKTELKRIEKKLNKEYNVLCEELSSVQSNISDFGVAWEFGYSKHQFFVFQNGKLIKWSDYHFIPEFEDINPVSDPRVLNLNDNIVMVVNVRDIVDGDSVLISGLIPLAINYPVNNEYLRSDYNRDIFSSSNIRIIANGDNRDILLDGEPFIGIEFSGLSFSVNSPWKLMLFLGGLFFLLFFIAGIIRIQNLAGRYITGFLIFLISLIVIRFGILSLGIPGSLIRIDFFDPRYYASSYMNPSFGDLFLNVILIWAIIYYLFSIYQRMPVIRKILSSDEKQATVIAVVFILIQFLGGYYIFRLISSINTHSQWELDISKNLEFSFFRMSSYFLFLVATTSHIMLSSICFNLIKKIISNRKFIFLLTGIYILISAGIIFIEPDLLWLSTIIWVYSLIIKYFRIPGSFNRLPYSAFIFIAVTTIMTSFLGAFAIYKHHKSKIRNEKERYASHLFQQNDIMAEYYLAEAADKIRNDVFIQSRLLSPFATKQIIRDKIQRVYFKNYFDKYDINILLFNGRGQPFTNTGPDYHEIRDNYARNDFQTEYDELYLLNANQPGAPTMYLKFLEIKRYSSVAGYIIINLRLKRVVPTNVFPKLLKDDRFDMTDENISFGYVMYKQGKLITQSGEHQGLKIKDFLEESKILQKGFKAGNNSYLGFKGDNETVILISSGIYNFRLFAGNFSFLFSVFSLVFLVILLGVAGAYQISGRNLNYATRIQIFLNIAFIVPLIVVSITTLTRLSRNYNDEMDSRYQDIAKNLSMNIAPFLADYLSDKSEVIDREELTNELSMTARIAECDINYFGIDNMQGRLLSSTQSLIYEKGILSRYINPVAGNGLYTGLRDQIVLREYAGELEYKSAYTRIESPGSGNMLGVLSIPFFSSQQEIDEKVSDLMVNLLNIFTVIFIIFLIISYFTSFYLTQPIQLLIQKIRKTSLEGDNEPLRYMSNDEIGQIVNEYNKMLIKLKESRIALAKTEKESAWREMARQVAHEIKNPLTPMKLTIQHLSRRIQAGKDEESRAIEKSLNSLLHNIDTLSGIASSFSTYAQMPVPEIEEFDFQALLKKTAGLYSNEGEARIELDLPDKKILTEGDPNWLGRAISNLIINGIQAVDKNQEAIVQIRLEEEDNSRLLLSIRDNGSGIAEDVRDKVFMPNFSTKYSGSGIGLAITKRAIEHAGGKIWFETIMGEGTTFFVELSTIG